MSFLEDNFLNINQRESLVRMEVGTLDQRSQYSRFVETNW